MNNVIGTILEILPVKEVGKNNFKIQQVVVNIATGVDVNPVPFDCKGNDVETLSRCSVGDMVSITYNLQGRSWQGKFYVNIVCQTLNVIVKGKEQPIPVEKEISDEDIFSIDVGVMSNNKSDELSDLPFTLFIPLLLTTLIQYFI